MAEANQPPFDPIMPDNDEARLPVGTTSHADVLGAAALGGGYQDHGQTEPTAAERMLEDYEPFRDVALALRSATAETSTEAERNERLAAIGEKFGSNVSYLGAGNAATAFRVRAIGGDYAVKVLHDPSQTTHIPKVEIDNFILTGMRTVGLDGWEQVVAASYEDGVKVSMLVSGEPVSALSSEGLEGMGETIWLGAIRHIIAGYEAGVVPNLKAQNFIFDGRKLVIVDAYPGAPAGGKNILPLGFVLGHADRILNAAGVDSKQPPGPGFVGQLKQRYKAALAAYTGEDLPAADKLVALRLLG